MTCNIGTNSSSDDDPSDEDMPVAKYIVGDPCAALSKLRAQIATDSLCHQLQFAIESAGAHRTLENYFTGWASFIVIAKNQSERVRLSCSSACALSSLRRILAAVHFDCGTVSSF